MNIDNIIFVIQNIYFMAKSKIPKKKLPKKEDNIDELEQFIEKKKIQNEALKKIIETINKPATSPKKK